MTQQNIENKLTGAATNRDPETGQIRSMPITPDRPKVRSKGIGLYRDQMEQLAKYDVSTAEACRRAIDYCLEHCPEIFEAR